jgi:preprotein translocase subunit SecD
VSPSEAEPVEESASIQFRVVWELPGSPQGDGWEEAVIPGKDGGEKVWISKERSFSVLKGDIAEAEYKAPDKSLGFMTPNPQMAPTISVALSKSRAAEFAKFTRDSVGRRVAILVDGTALSAPKMMEPIENGEFVLTGPWTDEEAKTLVEKLR